MTDRIGVPWIDRGALFVLILWFIGCLSLGTLVVVGPAFQHYLERLREGHRVEALRQERRFWQTQETDIRAELDARPASPSPASVSEWLAQFPSEITVLQVTSQPGVLELTVEAAPEVLWSWMSRAIPAWSGLSPVSLRMQGAGSRVQGVLTLRREALIRIASEEVSSEPAAQPVWGPLSACPEFTLASRVGRTAHLDSPSGIQQAVQVSDWVTQDWQLIHVSGRTLHWRSRLGTLCQSEPPAS